MEGALFSGWRGCGGGLDVGCACGEEVLVGHFDVFEFGGCGLIDSMEWYVGYLYTM